MIRKEIQEILRKVTGEKTVQVDIPENTLFGDYSTNIVMILAKKKSKMSNN